MKKLNKLAALALTAVLATALTGCPDSNGSTVEEDDLYEGAYIIESLADVATSWQEEINIEKAIASRMQVGSKVVFDVDINGEYAKFMVASGWADCNTETYYKKNGKTVAVVENADNPGVYETVDGAVVKGTYYFVVTEDNIDILKNGFGIRGNFVLKKIGITNLADAVADPDDSIELVEPAAKEGYYTFWVQSSGSDAGTVMFILNYEEATLDAASSLTNVDIEYIINDGEAQHYTDDIAIEKNQWGTDYQVKLPLFAEYKVTKNDAIYIKITATVDNEAAATIIQGNLIDTDSSVNYWKEMCVEEQQKQILTGITYSAE